MNQTNPVYQKLMDCLAAIREKTDFVPEVGIVLGSGLGGFAESIRIETIINYKELPGFPVSTASGHKGQYVFGYVDKVPVVVMQGRVHYYEGYEISDVVLPIRLMGLMGAKILFLTNSSGGIKEGVSAGELMLITDQISDFMPSVLRGPNLDELGVRFPDMSHIYDSDLQDILRESAAEIGIKLHEGVYIELQGPSYESPAEIRMCKALGADAVGMSTAVEAIAANHMGMRICGVSCISNLAAGISPKPLSHEDVKAAADRMGPQFQKLVNTAVRKMGAN